MTLDLLHQLGSYAYIDTVNLGPRMIVIQASGTSAGDPHINWDFIALDMHARTQFLLTHATREVVEVGLLCSHLIRSIEI